MKYLITLPAVFILLNAYAQPLFHLSENIYRVPYLNSTSVHITSDHLTHSPQGRYDMSGINNGGSCSINYPIVAAAEGIIRRIVDNHNTKPPACDPDCADFNNYVWIEHSNGEWSKYSHMKQSSTTITAGLQVGDQVCAGTLLGYECEIGQASGPHLHFEVRRPNDPANVQISVAGGFMSDADHVIPVINTIGKHHLDAGDDVSASASTSCGGIASIFLGLAYTIPNNGIRIYLVTDAISTTSGTAITYQNGSNGMYQAGNSITISPGFTASPGSYFHARIGTCVTTNLPGACN